MKEIYCILELFRGYEIETEFDGMAINEKQYNALAADLVKLFAIPDVNNNLSLNYLVDVLKRTLSGNNDVKVEFDNEENNINYILDICNNFKKELEKDCSF